MIQYIDLRIEIGERIGRNRFSLCLRSEVTGEARGKFVLPFSILEIGRIMGMVDARVGKTGGILRRGSAERQRLIDFGRGLFEALLASTDIRACYERAKGVVLLSNNQGLRLRLVISDPLLRVLPWEFLHDGEQFLAISNRTPLVRYVELPSLQQVQPLAIEPPLRVLVAIAAPKDQPALDGESERIKIEEALGRISDSVEVKFLGLQPGKPLTYQALQRCLSEAYAAGHPFHILHFIGHGQYVSLGDGFGAGYLILEDESGRGEPYSGDKLGNLLRDHPSVRLAVINACEAARTESDNPFADVATALVRAGGPAVVAMQFSISDRTAKIFSSEFYFHLALGYPVDAALAEARKTMYAVVPDSVEFGAPVLFMRARDGHIFDVPEASRQQMQDKKPQAKPRSRIPSWAPWVLAALLVLLVGGAVLAGGAGWLQGTLSPFLPPAIAVLSTETSTPTPSPTDSSTPTRAPSSPTPAPTFTAEPTSTVTPTPVPTQTPTPAPTQTPTLTPKPTSRPTATPTRTLQPTATATPIRQPTASPTPPPLTLDDLRGWILFLSNRDGGEAVYAMKPDGSAVRPLPDRHLYDQAQAAEVEHPNGYWRLTVYDHDGNLEIWRQEQGLETQLTSNPADDYAPAWSPDAWHIVFVSGRSGNDDIYVMDANGGGEQRLTYDDGFDKHPSWSPDTFQIVFWSDRAGRRQLWLISAQGSDLINLSSDPYDDWDPVWVK